VKDLDDEVAEAEKAETTGQLDHQNFLQDASKRRSRQKSLLISKRQAKASLETELATLKKRSASQHREEQDQKELKASLDSECAWLLGNWDDRVAARERDVQALANAKATIQRAQDSSRSRSLRR